MCVLEHPQKKKSQQTHPFSYVKIYVPPLLCQAHPLWLKLPPCSQNIQKGLMRV